MPQRTKTITVFQVHPDPAPERFCHAIAEAYQRGAQNGGHRCEIVTAGLLDIPLVKSYDAFYKEGPARVMETAIHGLKQADHIVIIFPLWLGGLPAFTKAFFEQLMRPGVAFSDNEKGFPKGLMKGKSARIIVTMGMPAMAYRFVFGAHGVRGFDKSVLGFAGFGPVRRTFFGRVDSDDHRRREAFLEKIERLGKQAL